MQLGKTIIYATDNAGLKHQWDIGDNNLVYGLAVAWTYVDALKHAGANPTRASLMKALRNLNETGANKNPFVYPGMVVKTSVDPADVPDAAARSSRSGAARPPTTGMGTFGGVLNSGSLDRSLLLSSRGSFGSPSLFLSAARPDP